MEREREREREREIKEIENAHFDLSLGYFHLMRFL
jgi:hypothetical protein